MLKWKLRKNLAKRNKDCWSELSDGLPLDYVDHKIVANLFKLSSGNQSRISKAKLHGQKKESNATRHSFCENLQDLQQKLNKRMIMHCFAFLIIFITLFFKGSIPSLG
jgi:hypothetical protein